MLLDGALRFRFHGGSHRSSCGNPESLAKVSQAEDTEQQGLG